MTLKRLRANDTMEACRKQIGSPNSIRMSEAADVMSIRAWPTGCRISCCFSLNLNETDRCHRKHMGAKNEDWGREGGGV